MLSAGRCSEAGTAVGTWPVCGEKRLGRAGLVSGFAEETEEARPLIALEEVGVSELSGDGGLQPSLQWPERTGALGTGPSTLAACR